MSNLFNCKDLELKTNGLFDKCEGLMDTLFKASGCTAMDVLSFDAKTGGAIGGCMEIYKESKCLAVMQAKTMDNMIKGIDELKEMNNELRKQNDELRLALQDLSRKVEKIGK